MGVGAEEGRVPFRFLRASEITGELGAPLWEEGDAAETGHAVDVSSLVMGIDGEPTIGSDPITGVEGLSSGEEPDTSGAGDPGGEV